MGRSDEFLYGRGEPEHVDLDLSDKVTDHPFYGQSPAFEFHQPDLPQSERCLEPGCGRSVNEHKAIHLPPTRAGFEMFQAHMEGMKAGRREAKEQEAHAAHNEEQNMKGIYGTGPHFMSGQGWSNERGPRTKAQFRQHLVDDHDVWPEDAKEMEDPATAHARWHANQEYGGENHTHHAVPKRPGRAMG